MIFDPFRRTGSKKQMVGSSEQPWSIEFFFFFGLGFDCRFWFSGYHS
jgi:hypothetical protein